MAPPSVPPPSSKIPGNSSGSGAYIVGFVALAGLVAALLLWKKCSAPQPTATPQAVTVSATATQEAPISLNAPPPPPKIEDLPDAGSDAGKVASKGTTNGAPGPGPCGNCAGSAPDGLKSALRSTAQSAQGCYQRALRTSEVSGSMTVAVNVSSTGGVCGVSIVNDSTNSGEVRSCVLGKFQGRTFPAPSGGCVSVNIPISFTIKQ